MFLSKVALVNSFEAMDQIIGPFPFFQILESLEVIEVSVMPCVRSRYVS